MAARHYAVLLTLGCLSASVAGAIPDQIPNPFVPSVPAPGVDCSAAGDELICNSLPGCLAITAFPASSGACSADFDFSPAQKEYVGCRSSALFCTQVLESHKYRHVHEIVGAREEIADGKTCCEEQALVWAANSDGEAFLFNNGCIPSGFTVVTQEEACSGPECTDLPGDLVPDCVLNVQDIAALIPVITGFGSTSPCTQASGDINMDSAIDVLDVTAAIDCIIDLECPSTCDALNSGFPCGPTALTGGLTCSVDTEACQKNVGGVCGGSPTLPNGECQEGCSDCSYGFYDYNDLPCACPSYSCVPKLSLSECLNDYGIYFGACFCDQDVTTGIQQIECFLP